MAASHLYGRKAVEMEPPFRKDLSAEAEEQPLLEAVTRKRLVQTLQAGKDLACALVNCKLWEISGSVIVICSYDV
jgi:hypothetical protein